MLVAVQKATIIYDGECPYCRNFVKLQRLREQVGEINLVDARSNDPLVKAAQCSGYSLDDGMLFIYEGTIHFGPDAITAMAKLSSKETIFARINRSLFKYRALSKLLYPFMKFARLITLRLLGRKRIKGEELKK